MRIKPILLASFLFLSSCNLSTSAPTQEPAIPPNNEIVPVQAVPTPSSIPSPTVFRDDFNDSLAEGWTWKNEVAENWNMSSQVGWLEIIVQRGHIVTGNYTNLLLRPAPSGNFEIETSLEFEPVANFQFAGLIIYQSDGNFLQAGRAYCEGTDVCVGSGLYFEGYNYNSFQGPNFATPYDEGKLVYLRLQLMGEMCTFFASPDGINWTQIGQHQIGFEALQVGLVAAQNNEGVPLPARFGYFIISSLN